MDPTRPVTGTKHHPHGAPLDTRGETSARSCEEHLASVGRSRVSNTHGGSVRSWPETDVNGAPTLLPYVSDWRIGIYQCVNTQDIYGVNPAKD